MANILTAIKNIIDNPHAEYKRDIAIGNNRANSAGNMLEDYIKDCFANTFGLKGSNLQLTRNKCFSYLGSQNRPPDIILRGGDAIEVKKIEDFNKQLQLNSSYPKDKMHSDSPLISNPARTCETWEEKDMLYCIGTVIDNNIKRLWFAYGDCFCAERSIYEDVREQIIDGIKNIPNINLIETKELGKVSNIDPLNLTLLRIRGMWLLENPNKAFKDFIEEIVAYDETKEFQLFAIMRNDKYLSFPLEDRLSLEKITLPEFFLKDIILPNPNNPAENLCCKLISYTK